MKRQRRLRKLVPDAELIRRRAADEPLRDIASDYDVAHTTLGRFFERPDGARELRQARQDLRAGKRAPAARRSAERRLEQEVRRRAREQAAADLEQSRAAARMTEHARRRRPRTEYGRGWMSVTPACHGHVPTSIPGTTRQPPGLWPKAEASKRSSTRRTCAASTTSCESSTQRFLAGPMTKTRSRRPGRPRSRVLSCRSRAFAREIGRGGVRLPDVFAPSAVAVRAPRVSSLRCSCSCHASPASAVL